MNVQEITEILSPEDEVETDPVYTEVVLNDDIGLFSYQEDALRWLKNREADTNEMNGSILCLRMGLGKTMITLHRIAEDIVENHLKKTNKKTLVICSKTIMGEWSNDLRKFFGQYMNIRTLFWHTDFTPPEYSRSAYRQYLNTIGEQELNKYDLVITTYEMCMKSAKLSHAWMRITILGQGGLHDSKVIGYRHPLQGFRREDTVGIALLHNYDWNRLVTDESHVMCNVKTNTFLSACSLYGKNRLCLTGTPVRNNDADIWSLLFFCGYDKIRNPREWTYSMFDESVQAMILNIEYNENTMKIPNKRTYLHSLQLGESEKRIYRYYFIELWEQYNKFIQGSETMNDFALILALFTRLRQICIAPFLMTGEAKTLCYQQKEEEKVPLAIEVPENEELMTLGTTIRDVEKMGFGSSKLSYIIRLIMDITKDPENHILVFSSFSSVIRLIGLYFDKIEVKYQLIDGKVVGYKRQEKLDDFRKGRCQILLLNYRVGAQGLNLTQANHVITIEPWWSPVLESQAASRAHRTGQTKEVHVHRVIVKGTIEEQIYKIGLAKTSILDSYLDTSTGNKREPIPRLSKDALGTILRNAWENIY